MLLDSNLKADVYGYTYKCIILYTRTYIHMYSHNLCIIQLLKIDLFVCVIWQKNNHQI